MGARGTLETECGVVGRISWLFKPKSGNALRRYLLPGSPHGECLVYCCHSVVYCAEEWLFFDTTVSRSLEDGGTSLRGNMVLP